MWIRLAALGCSPAPTNVPPTSAPSAASSASAPGAAVAAEPAAAGQRSDVSVQQFMADHAKGVQLLDVRTPGEFSSGHVPGAKLAPLSDLSPEHPEVAALDKAQPVYIICQSGGRSSRAADQLAAAGFTTINVQGGTGAWVAQGGPVE